MNDILCGNKNSKILVLTHDLTAFYDFEKIFKDIQNHKKKGEKLVCNLFELTNKILTKFKLKKRNEYSELLSIVYQYAFENSEEYELVIGNIMRRMLEAFSTFVYKKGIAEVSCDEKILSLMGDPVYSDYYKNLMYRLILHGESHMEEKVKSLTDPEFLVSISHDEKQQIAKDIICFMYLLNKIHITEHLIEYPNAAQNLHNWCQSIKEFK